MPTGLVRLLLLTLASALLCAACYRPGLGGGFHLDDYSSLTRMAELGGIDTWDKARRFIASDPSSPAGRPLALASFLLDARDWPTPARPFLRTNLILHLACGLLLAMWLLQLARVTGATAQRAATAAWLGASVWLLHPLWVSTTLYATQRMTILSALFCLAGLLLYTAGRRLAGSRPQRGALLATLGLGMSLPAIAAKEVGVLLPLMIAVVDRVLLRPQLRLAPARERLWQGVLVGLPALGSAAVVGYALWRFGLQGHFGHRDFDLGERLLTQGPVLATYLGELLKPGISSGALVRDDFPIARGLLQPATTAAAWLLLFALASSAWFLRHRLPWLAAGVGLFLTGHLLESTVLPLELYFEHRNYLPATGLALLVCGLSLAGQQRRPKATLVIGGLVAVLLALLLLARAALWGQPERLRLNWAEAHPASPRAALQTALQWEAAGDHRRAAAQLERTLEHRPGDPELLALRLYQRCQLAADQATDWRELIDAADRGRYSRYLHKSAERLLLAARCRQGQAHASELLAALDRAATRSGMLSEQRDVGLLRARLLLSRGDADAAAAAYTRALQHAWEPSPALRVVAELASAGALDLALDLLAQARERVQQGLNGTTDHERWRRWAAEIQRLDAIIREERDRPTPAQAVN